MMMPTAPLSSHNRARRQQKKPSLRRGDAGEQHFGGSAAPMARLCDLWCVTEPFMWCLQLQGGYRACSRLGIDSNASPFLKISFETATAFLTEATLRGAHDDLSSPAARLVLGRVVESGTGISFHNISTHRSALHGRNVQIV
jgi:hypothetical protein